MASPVSLEHRWKARPVLALSLRAAIVLVPVLAALGATAVLADLVPPPAGRALVAWWGAMLLVGGLSATLVERAGRRVLPLVALLKLSMLFPDRAPSRFAVARQAGSLRHLRRLAQGVAEGDATLAESAATVLSLITALSVHDRRTRGHAERVRTFTDMLAEELGLAEDDRFRLRWAALLHDIGKLMVSAGVLNKPGKLDAAEWDAVRGHPEQGAAIAAPLLDWLGPWGRAIVEHHERYDGTGYPAGLAAEQLSPAGRIVAVADAYDTMTSARSYKKAIATRAAREELVRCAGTQFDPDMVRAFLSISLPRLLWATGPLSFLAQIPYISWLREVGQQTLAGTTQAVAAAATVAAVTAAVVAPAAATASVPGLGSRTPSPGRSQTGAVASMVSSSSTGLPSAPGGGSTPLPAPSPSGSPGPTGPISSSSPPAPGTSPSPSPSPSPLPLPLPLPSPSLSPLPLPLPSPSLSPLPLPSPSLSPLPGLTDQPAGG